MMIDYLVADGAPLKSTLRSERGHGGRAWSRLTSVHHPVRSRTLGWPSRAGRDSWLASSEVALWYDHHSSSCLVMAAADSATAAGWALR